MIQMKQLFLALTVVWAVTIQAQTEGERLGKLLYPEMVLVEGGTFVMGDTEMEGDADEQPAHEVTLKSFSIAKTETTVLQYKTFCNATGRVFPHEMADEVNDHPMTYVSWHDAVAYTDWLADKTGKNYRLPTEAEWEYAARGGNKSEGHKYSGGRSLDAVGWYGKNVRRRQVALKRANELGIYDMSGNVWEWCKDWYGSDYYATSSKENPRGSATGSERVVRGGSFYLPGTHCRVSSRDRRSPADRYGTDGFRVVLAE
jgi:sulfatase modifying factor 1